MPVSESKRKSNDKYNSKCDTIQIRPLKPIGDRIRSAAAVAGKSLQSFILDAVAEKIKRDQDGENIPAGMISSLTAWLKDHGFTEDQIIDCIESISKTE